MSTSPQPSLSASKLSVTYAIQSFDETGAMRAPYLLLKGFVAAGWLAEIVTMASENNQNLDNLWGSVPVIKVAGANKRQRLLRMAAHFLGRRPGNLVLTWIWDWHCYGLLLARLLYGTKYVLILDTYTHRAFGSSRDKQIQSLRYGPLLRHASLILAEAPACRDAVLNHLPNARVEVIPSSLWQADLEAVEAKWRHEGWQPQRRPVILYAGRLVERKNVHHLIDAFARLAASYSQWSLEIVGPTASEPYAESLKAQVQRLRLSSRIRFQPGLTGEPLYRKYRECAIYTLPSEGEGFPTSILEAMYFGGAIVAGNSGYVAYQLENNCGLLHTPGDLDRLCANLESLMKSESVRNDFMQRARERLLNMFTWDRYFTMLEERCRQLIS